jgi:4-amino-4-deoxy-L-arabinose transferase-like glycosyltransferase
MAVGGLSIFGLRLSSALAGAAGVLATYWLVSVLHNRRTAVLTAIIMTTYHYHIHWSRIGLNNIWDTLWVPLMLAPFAWGWRKGWSGGAILSGIAVGLSQYFYAGSRLGLILLAFLILQLFLQTHKKSTAGVRPSTSQPQFGRPSTNYPITQLPITNYIPLLKYTLQMTLITLCIAAPLFIYAILDPIPFFDRSQTVWGWRPETILLATGDSGNWLEYGWQQLWRSAGAFTAVPDVTGFYGPGVPLLIGLSGPLFIIGLFWALYKQRWLPVLWIVLTVILGGFLLSDPPGSSHYVVAIPAICWLVATPLDWLASIGRERLAIILLAAIVAVDLYFYFFIYINSGPRDLIHVFPVL